MKKKYFIFISIVLLGVACSKIPDTISKFQNGINNNDYLAVAETISKDAMDYNSLANNNWSGLQSQVENWRLDGNYTFSGVPETASSSPFEFTCNVQNDSGTFPSRFEVQKEGGILGLFQSWKILEWQTDSSNNGFADDDYRIQVVQ